MVGSQMPVATDVLNLSPGDIAQLGPVWEPGIETGSLTIAMIEGDAADWAAVPDARDRRDSPLITVGVLSGPDDTIAGTAPLPAALSACDLVLGPGDDRDRVLQRLRAIGTPALVAAQVLRAGPENSLALESLAYSTLLGGEPFRRWRAGNERRTGRDAGEARVALTREQTVWRVTLTRPGRHNAFDAQMREELCDALDVIAAEPSLPVVLLGDGPSFCSGGDLGEFGTAAGTLQAHLIRCGRSVARRLQRLGDRLVAGVHGSCVGAGVELAAFARTLIADAGTSFELPELRMGLNLGTGGSLSIPRRIGRHRTFELLLADGPLGAPAAREWGLVDAIVAPGQLERACIVAAEALA